MSYSLFGDQSFFSTLEYSLRAYKIIALLTYMIKYHRKQRSIW